MLLSNIITQISQLIIPNQDKQSNSFSAKGLGPVRLVRKT